MNIPKMMKNDLRGSLARRLCVVLTTVSMMMLATAAHAACGSRAGASSFTAPNMLSLANIAAVQTNNTNPIVGLWHVTYTAEGQLFYEAFDTWHSDGTEIENANLSPTEGNICMGVWKKVGSSIHLTHVGWAFDNNGNPAGMFTLTEKNAVGNNGNSYRGTFDYKAYDPNGNLIQEVTGTLSATRISVN